MSSESRRLSTRQMARFVSHGYLQFDSVVPAPLNEAFLRELGDGLYEDTTPADTPLQQAFEGLAFGQILRLSEVEGVVLSLLGPEPVCDYHEPVRVPANMTAGVLGWHSDTVIEREQRFAIHIMYFPHDTPREMGGTLLLPGSHFTRVSGGDLMHIENIVGQVPVVCRAGTLVFKHYDLWHSAQRNSTDWPRVAFKVRISAGRASQQRAWNTVDMDDAEVDRILGWLPPWVSGDSILCVRQKNRLWGYLTSEASRDPAR